MLAGDNPFDWSLPLFRVGGIRVRLHLFFILYVAFELVQAAINHSTVGLTQRAIGLFCLFSLVLLHEFGHCVACRWVGGTADDILLWPLGGLAFCRPPHNWKASLITTLCGPGVNFVLAPCFALALLASGIGWEAIIYNPFKLSAPLFAVANGPPWAWWLWWLHHMNLSLFLFNMLVPMFPMDCGRVLQELLWSRMGYAKATWIATTVGLAVAGILAVLGLSTGQSTLLALAVFGGMSSYNARQGLRYLTWEQEAQPWTVQQPDTDDDLTRARRRREQQEKDDAEVDRILDKVSKDGISSLTSRERQTLQRVTSKRRGL